MRIQVIGHEGMLGKAVSQAVIQRREHTLVIPDVPRLEHVQPRTLETGVVINCAGLVKQRQEPASKFMLVNAYSPQRLAECCDVVGARLIHVSTDCVFLGPGPHSEYDLPDAPDIYARSKQAGEVIRPPHLTLRTSFVGFSERRGLILDLLQQDYLYASTHLLWSGHWVDTVAEALVTLAERDDITGLLHMPGEFQTRLQLVRTLAAQWNSSTDILENEYTADRRLISARWEELGLPQPPPFLEQLERLKQKEPVL